MTHTDYLAASDITVWYQLHETCPNCGTNLREMNPMANLYPHWTADCKRPREIPVRPCYEPVPEPEDAWKLGNALLASVSEEQPARNTEQKRIAIQKGESLRGENNGEGH